MGLLKNSTQSGRCSITSRAIIVSNVSPPRVALNACNPPGRTWSNSRASRQGVSHRGPLLAHRSGIHWGSRTSRRRVSCLWRRRTRAASSLPRPRTRARSVFPRAAGELFRPLARPRLHQPRADFGPRPTPCGLLIYVRTLFGQKSSPP